MPIEIARLQIARVFTYRCVYLFLALLLLIILVPFVSGSGGSAQARIMANVLNVVVLIAAVAAMGRSKLSFAIGLLFALPMLVFQIAAFGTGETRYLAVSWGFGAAVYLMTFVYLLRYVFSPTVMTADKLYGAAAAYVLVGVLWAYLFVLLQYFYPGSFAIGGTPIAATPGDLIYFSFTVLTTTGFGDVTPVLPHVRSLVILEQIIGVLFVAILIARLAGVYPPSIEEGKLLPP